MVLEKSAEITLERMRIQSESKNSARLQMWLVMEVKFDPVKNNIIGTWSVRFMNQGKLEVVKQEMERVNINILGISELKSTGMGEFKSDDH